MLVKEGRNDIFQHYCKGGFCMFGVMELEMVVNDGHVVAVVVVADIVVCVFDLCVCVRYEKCGRNLE